MYFDLCFCFVIDENARLVLLSDICFESSPDDPTIWENCTLGFALLCLVLLFVVVTLHGISFFWATDGMLSKRTSVVLKVLNLHFLRFDGRYIFLFSDPSFTWFETWRVTQKLQHQRFSTY